ncbi:MAG TPA: Hsp20/alpha crystallin family protein [Thermoanaerobaculia bacterium]|nr:Hsp20/alpha crystallin family protein [Thermoanaerobaculia bacterium]
MTRVIRFSPFSAFEPFFRFPYLPEVSQAAAWNPPVDVVEQNDRILVKVEVPGIDEKDLHVTFEDGLLTVSGERQFERKDDSNYHRIERAYGSFTRSFTLPRSVDASQIMANYRNGVLEIEIPKKEESRPKQISINVNSSKQLNA